jgi:hypothetical protein
MNNFYLVLALPFLLGIMGFIHFTFIFSSDHKGFKEKKYNPFFLDISAVMSLVITVVVAYFITILSNVAEKEELRDAIMILVFIDYLAFVILSFSLLSFLYLRISLKRRMKKAGYQIILVTQRELNALTDIKMKGR